MTMENKNNLIGIPSIEGIEILKVDEFIRCEGLQRCTRIITCSKKDIINSYSIGQFRKLLESYDTFFSPHRSHVVNLLFLDKFRKAGEIVMKDGTSIPIVRNKKSAFLNLITVLQ